MACIGPDMPITLTIEDQFYLLQISHDCKLETLSELRMKNP